MKRGYENSPIDRNPIPSAYHGCRPRATFQPALQELLGPQCGLSERGVFQYSNCVPSGVSELRLSLRSFSSAATAR